MRNGAEYKKTIVTGLDGALKTLVRTNNFYMRTHFLASQQKTTTNYNGQSQGKR